MRPQFYQPDQSAIYFAGPQINQYYPPPFYPPYPRVGGRNDPIQHFVGEGVSQQLHTGVPSHPHPRYTQ